jgi:Type IV secretion system pilin
MFELLTSSMQSFSAACSKSDLFFVFPKWYKYLRVRNTVEPNTGADTCEVVIRGIGDTWLIVAAVIDILLRVASLVAVAMIIYAGIQYITSQGEPDKAGKALKTIINALIGLTIAISATILVTFFAGRFN